MTTYPTDLSAAEEQTARSRLRELAEKFTADGACGHSDGEGCSSGPGGTLMCRATTPR